MDTKKPDYKFRVLVVGECEVGKTSIIRRFTDDEFSDTYEKSPPINMTRKLIEVDGKTVFLLFVDKPYNEFVTRTFAHFRGISALLIVYDVTEQESFQTVPRYVSEGEQGVKENIASIPRLIVANKIDLEDRRTVQYTTGKELADEKNYEYVETSAKTPSNINEMFLKLARDMIEKQNSSPMKQETSQPQKKTELTQQQSEKKSSFCSIL